MRVQKKTTSESATSESNLKKKKLDVLEKEYFQDKELLTAEESLNLRQKRVCEIAQELDVILALCDEFNDDDEDTFFVLAQHYPYGS